MDKFELAASQTAPAFGLHYSQEHYTISLLLLPSLKMYRQPYPGCHNTCQYLKGLHGLRGFPVGFFPHLQINYSPKSSHKF